MSDNFVAEVKTYMNDLISKKVKSKTKLWDLPTKLDIVKQVHKKYGNFGSDIAKVEWNKIKETNTREMI
tara:strand:- start:656 stop:862 length:207 start_codon:yes stop_codon:yes gene_type:complete